MLKYLVLVALACCMQSGEAASENDIVAQFLSSVKKNKNIRPTVIMKGRNNYQARKQVFYIHGLNQSEYISEVGSSWSSQILPNCCTNLSKIRDDYVYTPGTGYYKLHKEPSNWNTAREICIKEGAHLAIVNSDSEKEVLSNLLSKNDITGAWVGIHNLYQEGDWTTVLDQSLESLGFKSFVLEPNNAHGNKKCGRFVELGEYSSGFCSVTLSFICEVMTTCM